MQYKAELYNIPTFRFEQQVVSSALALTWDTSDETQPLVMTVLATRRACLSEREGNVGLHLVQSKQMEARGPYAC